MASWGQSPAITSNSPIAAQGRNGDDHTAHLQTGETIVPPVISPELRAALYQEMRAAGIPVESYVVGSDKMSINPETGLPEFGFGSFFKKIFKAVNKIPIVGPAILPAVAYATGLGPVGAALTSGVQTKALGGSWGQAIGAAAGSYIGGQIGGPGSGTVGSTLNEAGLGTVASQLGNSLSNVSVSSITGALLGSGIGTSVGGTVDAPKWGNEFANIPSTPTGGSQGGGVAIPGDKNNANNPQGPTAEEQALAAQRGAGITVGIPNVNYQTTVLDRETGRPRTINTSFSNNFDRRNSWGSGVSFA